MRSRSQTSTGFSMKPPILTAVPALILDSQRQHILSDEIEWFRVLCRSLFISLVEINDPELFWPTSNVKTIHPRPYHVAVWSERWIWFAKQTQRLVLCEFELSDFWNASEADLAMNPKARRLRGVYRSSKI